MTVLAVPVAGIAALFVAVVIAWRIHETFKGRWSAKNIDRVSAVICFVLLGSPAYTMLALGGCLPLHAVMLHIGIGCFYTFVVVTGVGNYVEGFVLATILCILLLFLIPVVTKLRSVDQSDRSTTATNVDQLAGHSSRVSLCMPHPNRGSFAAHRPHINSVNVIVQARVPKTSRVSGTPIGAPRNGR